MWQNSRSSLLKMQQANSDLPLNAQIRQPLSIGANTQDSGLKSKLHPFLCRTVIFILVLLYFGAFVPMGMYFHHDGIMFIPALRAASGDSIFAILPFFTLYWLYNATRSAVCKPKEKKYYVIQFARQHKPVILSNAPVYLGNYWSITRCDHMGKHCIM